MVLVKGKLYGFNMYCDQAVKKKQIYEGKTHICIKDRTSLYGRQVHQSALQGDPLSG